VRSRINWGLHALFSKYIAKIISANANVFIGISSFSLEALKVIKARGGYAIVDHASLHMQHEKLLIENSAKEWGVKVPSDLCSQWVIDKENEEFVTANSVFVPSSVARDSLVQFGVPANKIFVNPYGVDIKKFFPIKINNDSDEVFRVVQAAQVSLRKGALTTIKAFSLAGLENAELIMIGGGVEVSGIGHIIEKIKTPKTFLVPSVPFSKLNDYFNKCSVMVLSSVADGFALVVIYAMASGLPVIVTENVGSKDLVVDGVNGYVVPINSPEIIAEKLRYLYLNPDVCKAMGEVARKTVLDGFSWEDYGNRLVAFLRNTRMCSTTSSRKINNN
jgi:glycosyltransferase involved in cell wall biosynthesis